MTMYDMPTSNRLTHHVKYPRARPCGDATVVVGATMIRAAGSLGSEIKRSHAKLLKILRINLQDRIFTHRSRIMPCNRSISDPRALGSPYHGRMESHYPAIRTLAVRSYSSPHVLQYYGGSLLVVPSIHITAVPLILTLLPNPWRPKSS